MNWLSLKLKELLFFTISLSILMIIYTTLISLNIIPDDISLNRTITLIIGLFLFFLLGVISGKKEMKNGWLSGISSAVLILLVITLIGIFMKNKIDIFLIGKYTCFLLCSMIGGMFGVNLKPKRKRVK